jgi:FdhD protein
MSLQITSIPILKYKNENCITVADDVAIEEPLEISIAYLQNQQLVFKIIAVTMRTPGYDEELAIGFLFTENIIDTTTQIEKIEKKGENKICVFITGNFQLNIKNTERNFYTTSSCGVCGKASIEAIQTMPSTIVYPQKVSVPIPTILNLKNKLNTYQSAFQSTGGIHAAALFDMAGNSIALFEDVGRHNALDKLIGWNYLNNHLPLQQNILLLSGRASFELVQKAAMAHLPIVCAIGAPSSLAVSLAAEMDITLIGFLKEASCNIYCGDEKIEF